MKNIMFKILILSAFFTVTFVACEKEQEVVQTNNNSIQNMNKQITTPFMQVSYVADNDTHKWIAENLERPLEVDWYMYAGTPEKYITNFIFDFSDFPDIDILEATNNHVILSLDGIRYYYEIEYCDNNEMRAKLLDDDKKVLAQLNFFSEEFDVNSVLRYYQEFDYYSFRSKSPIHWLVGVWIGTKVAIGVGLITLECHRRILAAQIACDQKPDHIFQPLLCGGKCMPKPPNN